MTILALLFLLVAHYFAGSGLLYLFRIELTRVKHLALSVICGIVVFSLIPFFLELAHLPITFTSVTTGIGLACLLLNITRLLNLRKTGIKGFSLKWPNIRIYEWPFMILFAIILFSSAWRSFYFPPNARDMLSGPEVLAEYTVKEHTMTNSVYTVNLESTNNHQKPPFVLGLQIVYKLYGFPFGQVWVSIMAIAFCLSIYQLLKEKVHPVLAGTLLLCFLAIPELYAYTYIMLFDYGNMVLFFFGVYFLQRYFKSQDSREFYFASVLFAFSTLVRLETLVLVGMMVPLFWLFAIQKKIAIPKVAVQSIVMVAVSFFFYFLWVNVYLRYYIPGQFEVEDQVNKNLSDLSPLFKRFKDMNTELLFGKLEYPLWAYFIRIFLTVFILDLIITRKLSKESLNWLYAVAVVYFGLPLLGYALPLMDLTNTTKRGLFKMMPFLLMIMASSGLLHRISGYLTRWETEPADQNKARQTTRATATARKNLKNKATHR